MPNFFRGFAADAHDKHAFSQRIERPRVADLLASGNPLYALNDVV